MSISFLYPNGITTDQLCKVCGYPMVYVSVFGYYDNDNKWVDGDGHLRCGRGCDKGVNKEEI